MKKLVPYPVLSVTLAIGWLSLTGVSAAQAVLAVGLAIAIPRVMYPFLEGLPQARAAWPVVRLTARVVWDIIVANLVVTRQILGRPARLSPAFIEVPLVLRHPHAMTLLATIISMTPGTLSAGFGPDARTLLVHALHVDDAADMVATIKAHYEGPLQEIFEC